MQNAVISAGVGALLCHLEDSRTTPITTKNALRDSARQGAEAATAVVLAQLAFTQDPTVSSALIACLGTLCIRLAQDAPFLSARARTELSRISANMGKIAHATNLLSAFTLVYNCEAAIIVPMLTSYSYLKFQNLANDPPVIWTCQHSQLK